MAGAAVAGQKPRPVTRLGVHVVAHNTHAEASIAFKMLVIRRWKAGAVVYRTSSLPTWFRRQLRVRGVPGGLYTKDRARPDATSIREAKVPGPLHPKPQLYRLRNQPTHLIFRIDICCGEDTGRPSRWHLTRTPSCNTCCHKDFSVSYEHVTSRGKRATHGVGEPGSRHA